MINKDFIAEMNKLTTVDDIIYQMEAHGWVENSPNTWLIILREIKALKVQLSGALND